MLFSEKEFYLRRREVEGNWSPALWAAIAAHILTVALALWLPSFIDIKTLPPLEAVSINFMPSEPPPSGPATPRSAGGNAGGARTATPPPSPPADPIPPPTPPPPVEPEPAPVPPVHIPPEPPAPPPPTENAAPISIAPDKRKVRVRQDTRLDEEKQQEQQEKQKQQQKKDEEQLQKKLEQLAAQKREIEKREQQERERKQKEEERRQEIKRQQDHAARAEREQRQAEAEAKHLRDEADRLAGEAQATRDALATTRAQSDGTRGGTASSTGGAQGQSSVLEQTYWSAVVQRLKSYWILPETRSWDPSLFAQVVLTINREGEVVNVQIEQSSGDPAFDKEVRNTIDRAKPMPRFPAAMQQDRTEGGLKFRPGELGNR